ncbi:hypothetical protein K2X83_02960 [Patescibacteria group bacterium]|nr:hypothetical protein [Patescibacteria group bacterium]
MRIFIAISILCLAAFTAHAVSYSNDTNSVDIDYQGPAPIGAPDSNLPQGGTGGGGGGDGGGGAQGGGSSTQGGSGDSGTVTVSVSTNGSSGNTPQGAGSGGTSGSEVSGEDILNTLFGNQALTISGGSDGEQFVRLNGKKAREALKARGITSLSITNRFTSKFLSKKDFALGAASSVLKNENIEEVILSLNTVQLTYSSQGRLFAVFPFAFPITITVNPYADTPESRVLVKFPWYSFFLQKFVSKTVLVRDINAAIDRAETSELEAIDARGKFLEAITDVITLRTDTVEGTLR